MVNKNLEKTLNGLGRLKHPEKQDKEEYFKKLQKIADSKQFRTASGIHLRDSITERNIGKLPTKLHEALIYSMHFPELHKFNEGEFRREIASAEACKADLQLIENEGHDFMKGWASRDLKFRAVPGHAQNNHSGFREIGSFANTTTWDVLHGLEGINAKINRLPVRLQEFQERTQIQVDQLMYFVEDIFNNPMKYVRPVKLKGTKNVPFLGSSLFTGQPIAAMEFVRALYYGVCFDTEETRSMVHDQYDLMMGWGTSIITDRTQIAKYGLTLQSLADTEYTGELKLLEFLSNDKRLKLFKKLGIARNGTPTIDTTNMSWDEMKEAFGTTRDNSGNLQLVYMRGKKGPGISDDYAIKNSTLLPQTFTVDGFKESEYAVASRFLGSLAADYVDTIQMDSKIIVPGGQDELIKIFLENKFKIACRKKEFRDAFGVRQRGNDAYSLVSNAVLTDFVAASANVDFHNELKPRIVHSSQRQFYKSRGGSSAIGEYMKLIEQNQLALKSGQKPLVKTPEGATNRGLSLTFEQINSGYIIDQMKHRADLLYNPETRRHNLEMIFNQ